MPPSGVTRTTVACVVSGRGSPSSMVLNLSWTTIDRSSLRTSVTVGDAGGVYSTATNVLAVAVSVLPPRTETRICNWSPFDGRKSVEVICSSRTSVPGETE